MVDQLTYTNVKMVVTFLRIQSLIHYFSTPHYSNMAKRLIQKKILHYETLLTETKGFFKRLLIRYLIWDEKLKLKKYFKKK